MFVDNMFTVSESIPCEYLRYGLLPIYSIWFFFHVWVEVRSIAYLQYLVFLSCLGCYTELHVVHRYTNTANIILCKLLMLTYLALCTYTYLHVPVYRYCVSMMLLT